MFDRILLWSHLVLRFFMGRRGFLITASISVLVIGLFIISIFSGSVLGDWTFLRICPFLPGYPFYCHIVVHYALSVVTSLFSFLILLIWFFSLFSLMSLAKGLSVFCFLFFCLLKEPTFSFINLYYCFFHFFFIYFCLDLYDFFRSTNFGGVLFFIFQLFLV